MHGVKNGLSTAGKCKAKHDLKSTPKLKTLIYQMQTYLCQMRSWLLFVQQLFQTANNKSLVSYHKTT